MEQRSVAERIVRSQRQTVLVVRDAEHRAVRHDLLGLVAVGVVDEGLRVPFGVVDLDDAAVAVDVVSRLGSEGFGLDLAVEPSDHRVPVSVFPDPRARGHACHAPVRVVHVGGGVPPVVLDHVEHRVASRASERVRVAGGAPQRLDHRGQPPVGVVLERPAAVRPVLDARQQGGGSSARLVVEGDLASARRLDGLEQPRLGAGPVRVGVPVAAWVLDPADAELDLSRSSEVLAVHDLLAVGERFDERADTRIVDQRRAAVHAGVGVVARRGSGGPGRLEREESFVAPHRARDRVRGAGQDVARRADGASLAVRAVGVGPAVVEELDLQVEPFRFEQDLGIGHQAAVGLGHRPVRMVENRVAEDPVGFGSCGDVGHGRSLLKGVRYRWRRWAGRPTCRRASGSTRPARPLLRGRCREAKAAATAAGRCRSSSKSPRLPDAKSSRGC